MKFFALTASLFFILSLGAHAQTFSLLESFPADGDTSVALEITVSFSFDAPLDTTQRFSNDWPIAFFAIEPADSITIDSLYFNENLTQLLLNVRHRPDTDYVWIMTGAAAQDTSRFCPPPPLNYTTAQSFGDFEVSGYVGVAVPVRRSNDCEQDYFFRAPLIAALMDDNPTTNGRVVRATQTNGFEGKFVISGVRPDVYWPTAFIDADFSGEIVPNWAFYPSVFAEGSFLDGDWPSLPPADGVPDSLTVADSSISDVVITFIGPGNAEADGQVESPLADMSVYPNPFQQSTTLSFSINRPSASSARIDVFDLLGRRVRTLLNRPLGTGRYEITWNGVDDQGATLPSGLYFYRVLIDETAHTFPIVRNR